MDETPLPRKLTLILPKQKLLPPPPIQTNSTDIISTLFPEDYTSLILKPDHKSKPLWICEDGRIILEAFNPLMKYAQDFLITISEPVSRPSRIHEYRITAYSLYAAVSVGMETDTILDVMNQFSKVEIPDRVVSFVRDCTMSYGKVKLVLKRNRYHIESSYPQVLRLLLKDPIIQKAKIIENVEADEEISNVQNANSNKKDTFGAVITLDKEDESDVLGMKESDFAQSVEIDKNAVEEVKRRCTELDFPLMEEYDFRNDDINAELKIDLDAKTIIRDYQEKSLSKMVFFRFIFVFYLLILQVWRWRW